MALAASATAIDAFGPLGVSHLINAITGAVKGETNFDTAVLPWIFVLGGIWLGAAIVYRGYEAVDVETSPRMRALA
jgi:hypothetical protein